MLTKTFRAESTIQTLQMVQAELGENAIVVSMREVPLGPIWNPWQKSSVEIVAAAPEVPSKPKTAPTTAPVLRPAQNSAGVEFIEERPEIEWENEPERKLAELRSQLPPRLKLNLDPVASQAQTRTQPEAVTPRLAATVAVKAPAEDKYIPVALKKIQEQLLQQGVDEKLVRGVLDLALETLSPSALADYDTCRKSVIQLLGAELRVQQGAGAYVTTNVVCLIGASGSGKTSAIAKLALFYSQKLEKKITWVCADTVRSGAIAEARAYADALGIDLKLVYLPSDMKEILANAERDDLFLADTPSYNTCNENQMIELGSLLSEMPRRCTYLVASATTKETDLLQLSATLGIFHLDGLIVTKLDETHSFGNVYNFARKNQIPLSYFTTDKETTRSLEVADPLRLVSALFGKEWNK